MNRTSSQTPLLDERLRAIEHLFLDVDGVMTDGGLYYDAQGESLKRFHVLDGAGIKRLLNAGVGVGIISGRSHPAIVARAQELGMSPVIIGREDKLEAFETWRTAASLPAHSCAHMGDDLPDLPLMQAVGMAFSVPDAIARVRDAADWVTVRAGGHGAVREVCDLILGARS
jgi:3-deoxy-D-manno-octulosonate 8-phosphate phosphatase (KDO 8-P phosphatase)